MIWSQTVPGLPDTAVAMTDSVIDRTFLDEIRISDDTLEAVVEYGALDSQRLDNKKHEVHLYGDAFVNYTSLSLKAGYIVVNLDSNIAIAQGIPDSTGKLVQLPQFSDGEQSFEARRMLYNFRSRKGIIYDAVTQEGSLYILGDKTKYIAAGADSLHQEDHLYNDGAIITSCNHTVPHYGIRASKIKTVPNKLAVIGPANLEINGVPTPLWLPFGFFPVTSGRRSGLIFPRDYEYSEAWGFGLREIGYYFPISDNFDLKLTGDIYFRGSWGIQAASAYVKRYKYRGSINLAFSNRINEVSGDYRTTSAKSYSIRVSHNQDSKAHPYRSLGGSINIQSNNFQSLNRNDAASVLTNTYSSNFSWSRRFQDKPYTLSVALNHSQNTNSGLVTVNAPNIDFRLNRIYPLKRKKTVGKEKWYEKLSFQYSGNSRTQFIAQDTALFDQSTWENAQTGVQHRATTELNFNLLKFFNFTPSIRYDETWFFKETERSFVFDENDPKFIRLDTIYNPDDSTEFFVQTDTLDFGDTEDQLNSGFTPFRTFSAGVSMSTQIFGTIEFKKGWLRGLRHVLKPSFSYSYTPASDSSKFYRPVQTDIRQSEEEFLQYNVLQGGIYSVPFVNQERQLISYSFNNIFEAKYFSKKDSSEKKLKLFDNIVINGNYNFAAKNGFKWSPVNMRGTTRFLKGITTLSLSAVFDPYAVDENGVRIPEFYKNTNNKLLRFDRARFGLNSRMTIKRLRDLFGPSSESANSSSSNNTSSNSRSPRSRAPEGDIFFDLFNNFNIGHNLVVVATADTTIISTHTINMRGNFNLTKNWAVTIGNIGYDFRSDRLTYPDIGLRRDLHCWELNFSWQPVRGTYSLYIGVKPGELDFLKIPHRKNNVDTFGGF